MKYYIKLFGEPKYIYTEIDSGGMSAWLTSDKKMADTWENEPDALKFVRRLAEPASKFRNDAFVVVT